MASKMANSRRSHPAYGGKNVRLNAGVLKGKVAGKDAARRLKP